MTLNFHSKTTLAQFLEKLSDALDVPDSRYEEAIARYESVGDWLSREGSKLAAFEPVVFVQGSFRLGTAIRPIFKDEEYDIDLVCKLQRLTKIQVTQAGLMKMFGDELGAYACANGMNSKPKPKRRCWTLDYAKGAQFHLDVLPAIPDAENLRAIFESRGIEPNKFLDDTIAITDENHHGYSVICDDWNQSNPRGYAEWFRERMAVEFLRRRQVLAEALKAEVEDVPEYQVKTPLQRAVQILKRHRDIMFKDDPDDKPISIIITTLAAKSYNNQTDLMATFRDIIFGMESHIKRHNGIAWVSNPVNEFENFADKWDEEKEKEVQFYSWINKLKNDFTTLSKSENVVELREHLNESFGERAVSNAIGKPKSLSSIVKNSALTLMSSVAMVLQVDHRQKPKWPVQVSRTVNITASYENTQGNRTIYNNDDVPVPAGCTIRFEAHTNTDSPFDVHWQVVNTGSPAENQKCLRGDFYYKTAGRGGLIRFEPTKFEGKHWVECFIVQNGTCVARSGEFFVNISGSI